MDRILLSHGGGGEETHQLIRSVFLKRLSNPLLERLEDAAILEGGGRLAFTTDSFTVSPPFFPGGDIGKLAVAGTVNDLAVMGAKPLYMSLAFILEEGFELELLERIAESLAEEARRSGVLVAAGDTKVVPRGQGGGVFIVSSGIGQVVREGISPRSIRVGDGIVVSGSVGNHGAALLSLREGFEADPPLLSDCRSMWDVVEAILSEGVEVHAMRDPTRGGLAGVLNEWAEQAGVEIEIEEEKVPLRDAVRGLCELMGLDPLHLACEGVVVFAVAPDHEEKLLTILRQHPHCREAELVGRVTSPSAGRVLIRTPYGVRRRMEAPSGELLPRIC